MTSCSGSAGCPNNVLARGLCPQHYAEWRRRRRGVLARGPKKEARIEVRVEKEIADRFNAVAPARIRAGLLRDTLKTLVLHLERKSRRTSRA